MGNANNLAIVEQSMPGLKPFLYEQSVALITKRGYAIEFGSGTLVSIGDRLFIATASHIVSDTPGSETWVLSYEGRNPIVQDAPIVNRGRCPHDDPDVGFMELGINAAPGYLNQVTCPLERLAIRGVGRPMRPVILIGAPGEYVKEKERIKPETSGRARPPYVPEMIAYYTPPLTEAKWPNVPKPDPSKDIFLPYPDSPAEKLETGEPIMLPDPPGMSGGGLWDQGFEDREFWTKESVRLIGIESRWNDKLRYVRAVQIIHWLRLIHANYVDLRPILEQSFPELAAGTNS